MGVYKYYEANMSATLISKLRKVICQNFQSLKKEKGLTKQNRMSSSVCACYSYIENIAMCLADKVTISHFHNLKKIQQYLIFLQSYVIPGLSLLHLILYHKYQ